MQREGRMALGQALWSAAHGGDPDVYIAILDALRAAGAGIPERHIPVNRRVDAWLAQHGSQAEAAWHGDARSVGAHLIRHLAYESISF